MQGILYEEPSFWLFFLITCLLGGWAAWMTGRACAQTWRSLPQLLVYLIPLGAAVRFIHFALFEGTLLSLHYYLVDTIVLMIIGAIGFAAAELLYGSHGSDSGALQFVLYGLVGFVPATLSSWLARDVASH